MGRTAKLTVSLPKELISVADRIAKERKVSRSKVISSCLEELAEKIMAAEMADGYKAMSEEQKLFGTLVSKIAPEVLPEWK